MTDDLFFQYVMVHFNKIFIMVVFISAYANSGRGGTQAGGEGNPSAPPSVCNPELCRIKAIQGKGNQSDLTR